MIQATGTRDLAAMLSPRSIALVGATDRSTWSKATFANLTTGKYGGEVHLVTRRGGTVHGRPAATSCATLGAKIDLGLLMVPAAGIEEAMDDLAAAGARNAVILTSGFAETGLDGAAHQQKLAELARRFDISILGPNCLGFVNFLDDVPLWTGAIRAPSQPGPIAVISQSGATAAFIACPGAAAGDRPQPSDLDRQRGRSRRRHVRRSSARRPSGARHHDVHRIDP